MLDVKKLLTKILGVVQTSAWTHKTIRNGDLYFKKHHGVVYLEITGMTLPNQSVTDIYTLPTGYRPEIRDCSAVVFPLGTKAYLNITELGVVQGVNGTGAQLQNFYAHTSFTAS